MIILLCAALMLQADPAASADFATQVDPEPLDEEVLPLDDRTAALAAIEHYFADTRSLRAGFLQQSPSGSILTGEMAMARPGRIRFDYADEVPLLVVADGETLSFIDYEIGQVTRWPVADTPLRILLGDGIDLARYGARVELAPGGLQSVVALVASDPDRPELGQISVYFTRTEGQGPDASRLKLDGWSVVDAQGGLTVVTLRDVEKNIALKPALWTFDDPRGSARRRRR